VPETIHTTRDLARLRNRRVVATILLIALSVMVMRDLLVRRWMESRPRRRPRRDTTFVLI
jgi:hypothetical protein